MPDFSKLVVGDEVIVDMTSSGERELHLVAGKVTKRTATRLTVEIGSEKFSKVFTNDGMQYPKPSGWTRDRGHELMEVNEENVARLKRSRLVRKIKSEGWNLDRLLNSSQNLAACSTNDLEQVVLAIRNIKDRVKEHKV